MCYHSSCFVEYVHLSKLSETKYGPPQTKPKNDLLVEALYYLGPLIKDGYRLTVAEINDFMSRLAENCDPELYNRDSKIHVYWTTTVIRLNSVLAFESMCP